ncbi:Vps5 C terminal like-domain-containing protein [Amylostereum chailletii]|nr:Vps5 C terminal like-domain-containing protein [Amylostereum chailletii]
MSGFDDLFKASSRALEENPFENPFSKPRSNSPDPWSSYIREPVSSSSHALEFDPTHNAFQDDDEPPTPVAHERPFEESESTPEQEPVPETDPLDSAAANVPEEEDERSPNAALLKSPGFKESIASDQSPSPQRSSAPSPSPTPREIPLPSSPPPPDDPRQKTPPPLVQPEPPTPSSARLPQRQAIQEPQSWESPSPFAPPHSSVPTVASPLDQPPITTFASLALGGETFHGGWDGAQSVFVNSDVPPPLTAPTQADDDDDDDKPLRPRPTEPTSPAKKDKIPQPTFSITVDDPQKVGDPIRGYTMYTVHTRTTSPLYSKPSFSVLRRYSDFLWLYETLSLNNPGVVVPPVPEKNTFGRFDDQFVQQRRMGLENCITKMANHPELGKDPDLKLFLESDTFSLDIKHRKAEMAQERGGLMASIGATITGPRFVETDEWFDRQKSYLDTLELQLRGLVKAVDYVSKHRSEVALVTGEFVQTVADLAASDVGKSLSHSLSALADLERKAQELEEAQAQSDVATLMTTADEYARLINSVRTAFSSRIRMYHQWQNAEAEARRVKQNHERNRALGKIATDRLGHALNLLADADRRALDAKQEFDHTSRLVKAEVARFERERIDDFKSSMERFLDGMIQRQKELIGAREAFQQLILKKVPSSNQVEHPNGDSNGSAVMTAVA